MGACVAGVDVHCLWGSGGGTGGRRWCWAFGLVDQTGNVDTVVGKGVISIGGVIPLHMVELTEICQIIDGVADVSEHFGYVCVFWFVFCFQLCSVKVKPPCNLFLVGEPMEMWWVWLPGRMGPSYCWNVGEFCLEHVCDVVLRCRLLIRSEGDGCMGAAAGTAMRRCGV